MAEEADELARRDRQRDVVERAQRAVDLAHADRKQAPPGSRRPSCRAGPSGEIATGHAGGAGPPSFLRQMILAGGFVIRLGFRKLGLGLERKRLEKVVLERVLVVAQRRVVGGHGHRQAGRDAAVEQAGALQLLEAGQVVDGVRGRNARGSAASCRRSPAGPAPCAGRAAGSSRSRAACRACPCEVDDAADLLDLGPRHRLVVGDDRQRLHARRATACAARRRRARGGRTGRRRCGTPTCPATWTRLTPRSA